MLPMLTYEEYKQEGYLSNCNSIKLFVFDDTSALQAIDCNEPDVVLVLLDTPITLPFVFDVSPLRFVAAVSLYWIPIHTATNIIIDISILGHASSLSLYNVSVDEYLLLLCFTTKTIQSFVTNDAAFDSTVFPSCVIDITKESESKDEQYTQVSFSGFINSAQYLVLLAATNRIHLTPLDIPWDHMTEELATSTAQFETIPIIDLYLAIYAYIMNGLTVRDRDAVLRELDYIFENSNSSNTNTSKLLQLHQDPMHLFFLVLKMISYYLAKPFCSVTMESFDEWRLVYASIPNQMITSEPKAIFNIRTFNYIQWVLHDNVPNAIIPSGLFGFDIAMFVNEHSDNLESKYNISRLKLMQVVYYKITSQRNPSLFFDKFNRTLNTMKVYSNVIQDYMIINSFVAMIKFLDVDVVDVDEIARCLGELELDDNDDGVGSSLDEMD